MVYQLKNKKDVIKHLSNFILSEKVFKELGEPIIYNKGDVFWVKIHKGVTVGFACVSFKQSSARLKYIYVSDEHRGNSFFSEMYKEVESFCIDLKFERITAVATNQALPIYQKYGFEISKSWKNYHNIFKTINKES